MAAEFVFWPEYTITLAGAAAAGGGRRTKSVWEPVSGPEKDGNTGQKRIRATRTFPKREKSKRKPVV